MDFKYTQANGLPGPKNFPNNFTNLKPNAEFMMPELQSISAESSPFDSSISFGMANPKPDTKLASLRVFATIMLNSWRRRREDVKSLLEKVEDLKKGSMKAKNQIHVYNTLFRVEQKRNDELQSQLDRSKVNINLMRSSCENLTTSVISLKADKVMLEEELQGRIQDLDALNDILSQTKTDLFRCMVAQRNLQTNLCDEQRHVQFLRRQKEKLINEICQLKADNRKTEEQCSAELKKKDDELVENNLSIKRLEKEVVDVLLQTVKLKDHAAENTRLKEEVEQLKMQVLMLRECCW